MQYHPLQTIKKKTQFVMGDSCVLPFHRATYTEDGMR